MSDKTAFNAGFAMACAILAKDHGEDALAYQLLDGAGIDLAAIMAAGLDREDRMTLCKVLIDNRPRRDRSAA